MVILITSAISMKFIWTDITTDNLYTDTINVTTVISASFSYIIDDSIISSYLYV